MSKILSHGNLYNTQYTCPRCECQFIPEKGDIIYPEIEYNDDGMVHCDYLDNLSNFNNQDNHEIYLYNECHSFQPIIVKCPECDYDITTSTRLICLDTFTELWLIKNETFIKAIDLYEKNYSIEINAYDSSKAEQYNFIDDIQRLMRLVGFYECYDRHFHKVKIPIKKANIRFNKTLYEDIKQRVNDLSSN